MLDPEFKTKWVAALESGEYSQARGTLKDNASYCCLGVACVVAGARFERDEENDPVALRDQIVISSEGVILTGAFCQEIGLSHDEMVKLYQMNDGNCATAVSEEIKPHSFEEIASYIKEKL